MQLEEGGTALSEDVAFASSSRMMAIRALPSVCLLGRPFPLTFLVRVPVLSKPRPGSVRTLTLRCPVSARRCTLGSDYPRHYRAGLIAARFWRFS